MSDTTTASELLITIKTLLDSKGLDAAKTELDKVIAATRNSEQAQNSASSSTDKAAQEMQKATRAAFALRMAANGSAQGFQGLTTAAMNLGNNLGILVGKITLVGAAFTAGWKIGTMITDLVAPLMKVKERTDAVGQAALDTAINLGKLNDVKFTKIIQELKEFYDLTVAANESLDLATRRSQALNAAKESAAIAKVMLDPDTPSRAVKIAEIRRKEAVNKEDQQIQVAGSSVAEAKEGLDAAGGKVSEARELVKATNLRYLQAGEFLAAAAVADLKTGRGTKEEMAAVKKERDNLTAAEKSLNDAYDAETKARNYYKDTTIESVQAFKLAEQNKLKAEREYTAEVARITAERDAATDAWLEALKKEQETPQDVAKKAKSDIIGSMHLESVVARDNAGLPASAKVQKEYDVGRGQAAVAAVTQAQADIQAGQSSDVVMANLVEVLNRLHVRLLGQVDNRKKLQDVINRLDGIEGEQRNQKSRETTAPGLN
jgi:hypothetical protein